MSSTQEVGEIFGAGSGPAHAMLRSPTVLIASVGLWGMNIYFFRLFGINYVRVLKYDLILLENAEMEGKMKDDSSTGIRQSKSQSTSEGTPSTAEYTSDDDDLMMEDEEEEADYSSITWSRLVWLSMSLLFLLHSTYYLWIDVLGGGQLGAVFAFYGVVSAMIVLPIPSTRWLRKATVIVLQRSFELFNPRCSCVSEANIRPVPFVDVFFADAMCSLSKVFFDWGMLFHMATHYPNPVPQSAYNILIPSAFAAVPFLIRARQCLVMYGVGRLKNDPKRFDHLWNALKYSTSIFPLCLSAYQKTVGHQKAASFEKYLIFLLAINALYALYWDIVMDWGMMQNPSAATALCLGGVYPIDQSKRSCGHALMRNRLRFGVAMSFMIVVADSILRFSWTLRFYHKLFPSGDSFVLCTQFLEVFRRALWNLLRVEWENLKQAKAPPLSLPAVTVEDEEMTSFLPSPKQGNVKQVSTAKHTRQATG